MTDQTDLAAMTLKELRQMAGDHQIRNRSRLAKDDLIEQLTSVLSAAALRRNDASPQAKAADAPEPEVLDAAALADLGLDTAIEEQDDYDSSGSPADADGEPQGEGERRKRRRRRRRGKRRGEQADDGPVEEQTTGEQPVSEPVRTPAADKVAATPAHHPAERTAARASERPDKAPQPRAQPVTPVDTPADERSRKPRLEGQQRPLAGVLERLRGFSLGILELCDPDTPSWAQARLGELLAEIGVVPTPCQGLPHPDYHTVVGHIADDSLPVGHIAVIESPGFSLRGDRGDLFPLRKAMVRLASHGGEDEGSDESTERPRAGHRERRSPSVNDSPNEADTDHPAAALPVEDAAATPSDQVAPAPVADQAAEGEQAGTSKAIAAPQHSETSPRRRRGRRAESAAVAVDPDPSLGPVLDEPEPKPAPRTTRVPEAESAASLPLVPLEAEELAALPKAEGFRHLGLNEQVLADIAAVGYESPSEIQALGIPAVMAGRDMIGQSQTGSGKTAAFALPILHHLYQIEGQGPAALVLCPTRELARQVHAEFTRMAGRSAARAALIYGGVSMDDQFRDLARHPHVVIGTPGRIIDHMRRRTLDLSRLRIAVLDEADQMLDIGFLPDMEWILKHTPPERQTILFSATMPEEIKKLAQRYMREPEHIHIQPRLVTVGEVDQKWVAVDHDKKTAVLAHFIESQKPELMVVFCNTRHQTDRVASVLKRKHMSAAAIHGDMPQSKREKTLADFRSGKLNCLLATNVAARGLDIPSVSHVFNYDVPCSPDEYVHRVGRTARMGRTGVARTFVTNEDGQFLLEIEKHIGLLLEEEQIEGITASTVQAQKTRSIADSSNAGPRLLKPIAGGIRLGRRGRR